MLRLWNGIVDVMKRTNHYPLKWAYIFDISHFLIFLHAIENAKSAHNFEWSVWFDFQLGRNLDRLMRTLCLNGICHFSVLYFKHKIHWMHDNLDHFFVVCIQHIPNVGHELFTINLYVHIKRVPIGQLHFFTIFLCIIPFVLCSLCLFL